MRFVKAVVFVALLLLIAGTAGILSGAYDIGADAPHWAITQRAIDLLRERSVAQHAQAVAVPDLSDPKRLADGAEHYAAMCTDCHLAPGRSDSELRQGLYPTPPNLAQVGVRDPAQAFWIIKHGVKLTAMPAWGKSHDDDAIWSLVAFVRQLPQMTPEQYRQASANAGGHSHHHHGAAEDDAHGDEHHDAWDQAAHGDDHRDASGEHTHSDEHHGQPGEHTHGDDHHDASDQHPHGAGTERAHPAQRSTQATGIEQRQADVRARGPDVMAFSLDATQHVFEKTPAGGTQRVRARAGHEDQVPPIRAHLKMIAQAFAARDFSGPAHIHGAGMPGLAELAAAPADALTVDYREIDAGAELTYRAGTDALRAAVHRWFDAQLADHGHDATDRDAPAHD